MSKQGFNSSSLSLDHQQDCLDGQSSNIQDLPQLSLNEFDSFNLLLQKQSGISICRNKILMLEARLKTRLLALKLASYSEYEQYLRLDLGGRELQLFINALTTNKTEFFREEVYTLAILCEELRLYMPQFDYRILGSDIDTQCVQVSKNGIYEKEKLLNVRHSHQNNYFQMFRSPAETRFRVGNKLRRRVKFIQHNLVEFEEVIPIEFNIIFLRNVLYFF